MKVLLLQPPIEDFYNSPGRLFPLGLCSLKAALGRHAPGAEVVVRDFHQGFPRRTAAVPRELADLEAFYPYPDRGPFRTFHRYYHFGASFEAIGEAVARAEPDLVGISSLFSAYHREVLATAEAVKKRCRARVVVGGPHASAAPETLLAHPAVDFVVRGEGERPLVELVRALAAGASLASVSNLGCRRPDGFAWTAPRENYPFSELPAPDAGDLVPGAYRLGSLPLAALASSRGCPRRCSFCAVHASASGYRRRPTSEVVAELRDLYGRGYRAFDFEDDNLTSDPEAAAELLGALAEAFPAGDVRFAAMNGLWWPSLGPELLDLLWAAGFRQLDLSAVSADAGVPVRTGRPAAGEAFARLATEAARKGFAVVAYQILGLPGEPLSATVETLGFLARLPVRLGASPFYLPPGSPLAAGRPPRVAGDLVRARLTALACEGSEYSPAEVYTLWVTTRILNFLKELPAGAETLTLGEALPRARELGGRWALGAELLEGLRRDGVLCAATPAGPRPLPRFDATLFARVASTAGLVRAPGGGAVAPG